MESGSESGGSRVIFTSSITGPLTGYAGLSVYGATKAGQLGFMRSAAVELAQHNITVNAIAPGNVITENWGQEQIVLAKSTPLNRFGTPEDMGNAVAFLASPESCYITGQCIVIDGGHTLPE
uniref:Carbonyl reductase family member 4-like n=1 Tax=Saccoglossus kowalevskii TaxID=10224 RepID=A0ABM0GX65_SACKO|nr:PREDICTED: carbonyl reductase family member 4-like [Saccoglossus kowalevskii]